MLAQPGDVNADGFDDILTLNMAFYGTAAGLQRDARV